MNDALVTLVNAVSLFVKTALWDLAPPDEDLEEDERVDEWYEDQGLVDHTFDYEPDDVPEHEDGDPLLEDILENLREREVGEEPVVSGVIIYAFSQEAVDERNRAWAAYYEKVQDDARRKAQDEEGWGEVPEEEVEVTLGATTMPLCPACGWTVDQCDVHDEEDLEIIRKHDVGEHEGCDPEGCVEANAELVREMEKIYGGEVDSSLHFEA